MKNAVLPSLKKRSGPAVDLKKTAGSPKRKNAPLKMEKTAPVRLSKSQISLGKKEELRALMIGLDWDPIDTKSPGLLSGLFGGKKAPPAMDLDASLLVFDRHGIHIDSVWMRKLRGMNNTIRHTGDNIDGEGEGEEDKEKILVNLEKLPEEVAFMVVTVSSFNGQGFNTIKNANLRIANLYSKKEIHRVNLEGSGPHTGMIMAVISEGPEGWQVRSVGAPVAGRSIIELTEAAQAHLPV